jgi:hypothetical protein
LHGNPCNDDDVYKYRQGALLGDQQQYCGVGPRKHWAACFQTGDGRRKEFSSGASLTIDIFDIEINRDPEAFVSAWLLRTDVRGINLEDIKSAGMFFISKKSCESGSNIPVFHDDQHGTAIISGRPLSTRWKSSARKSMKCA